MEKTYCDSCGKEMPAGSGLAHYSRRQTDIDLNGIPVRIKMYIWPHHNDVCAECAENIPALAADAVKTLLQWEHTPSVEHGR